MKTRPGSRRDEFFLEKLGDGDGRSDAEVKIGGDEGDFLPCIEGAKWGRETCFGIAAQELKAGSASRVGDRIEWIAPGGDKLYKFYETPSGRAEFEVVFGVRPRSHIFTLDLDFPAGLDFHLQGELSDWEKTRGNERPDEVIGSYAVYWSKRNNQYKTGKFCHIYRPILIDADGARLFADMTIDKASKRMTITMDRDWLGAAKYPVTLDPTLGYNTIGASTDATGNFMLAQRWSVTENGTATTMYLGIRHPVSAATYMAGIYEDQTGASDPRDENAISSAPVQILTTSTSMQFESGAIDGTLVNGDDIYLILNAQATQSRTAYDSASPGAYFRSRTHSNDMEDPMPSTAWGTLSWDISMYIDYTTSGGYTAERLNSSAISGGGMQKLTGGLQ